MNGSAKYIIRHLQGSENHLLREFLYEAIYIPEGVKPPRHNKQKDKRKCILKR